MENITRATVKLNGRIVGYLAELDDGLLAFQYDDEWLENGFSISPFSLPLENKVFINEKRTFNGLYGVFADSLPDGWGQLLVDRFLQKKGINPGSLNPITRLCIINNNGLGGLTYEPTIPLSEEGENPDLDALSKEVNAILDSRESNALEEAFRFGGSSGGARPKAHIKVDGEEWIVKFPCHFDPKDPGIKEFALNELARKCGINVNEYRLFPSKTSKGYFGAKRFDRKNGKRLHVISLAGLLETSILVPNLDYSHLFQVIESICKEKDQLYEAFRRMAFNVYQGNKDDHGKNFSFVYNEEKETYELSPAYDLTNTSDKFEHEMSVLGKGNPTDEDMLNLAKRFKLSNERCKEILNTIKKMK